MFWNLVSTPITTTTPNNAVQLMKKYLRHRRNSAKNACQYCPAFKHLDDAFEYYADAANTSNKLYLSDLTPERGLSTCIALKF